jgi:hypothetical protein
MKSDDADVIEDEATEQEIRRIRQKRGKQMSETTTTETHVLNCDSRLGYPCTCAPLPEPDTGEEWHVASESSREDGEATIKAGMEWIGQVKRKYAAQIVSNHNVVPKLVAALEAVEAAFFEDAKSGANVVRGKLIPLDSEQHPWIPGAKAWPVIEIVRAALALVKGRE